MWMYHISRMWVDKGQPWKVSRKVQYFASEWKMSNIFAKSKHGDSFSLKNLQ